MNLKGVEKILFLGITNIPQEYNIMVREIMGKENVPVQFERSLDPKFPDPPNGDPKVIFSEPHEIAEHLTKRIKNEVSTFFFFSTSTANIPIVIPLALRRLRFGIAEHSPTDGKLLRFWVYIDGQAVKIPIPKGLLSTESVAEIVTDESLVYQ